MNNYTNQIGIIITGCRNGYAVLCHSQNIDIASADIKPTIRDMREFMRVNTPLKDYYSLEFTPRSVVFTQYRSSIDSAGAGGGYIAISLHVPHNLQLQNPDKLLNTMMDAYFTEHIHPVFGNPLGGTVERIEPFVAILDRNAESISTRKQQYEVSPSNQSQRPKAITFTDVTIPSKVMNNPYHPEYYSYRKVMLLPEDFITMPQTSKVVFGEPIGTISAIMHPSINVVGKIYTLQQQVCKIVQFTRGNGDDCTSTYSSESFSPNEQVRITFDVYGKQFQFSGTLQDAIIQKLIIPQGKNYAFGFIAYTLPLEITGEPCQPNLWLESATGTQLIPYQSGGFKINSPGNYNLVWSDGRSNHKIRLIDNFNTSNLHSIRFVKHLFKSNQPQLNGTCKIVNSVDSRQYVEMPFTSDASGYISIVTPECITPQNIRFEVKGMTCTPDASGQNLTFARHTSSLGGGFSAGGGSNKLQRPNDKRNLILYVSLGIAALAVITGLIFFLLPNETAEQTSTANTTIDTPFTEEPKERITELKIINISTPFDSVELINFPKGVKLHKNVSEVSILLDNKLKSGFNLHPDSMPQMKLYSKGVKVPVATIPIAEFDTTLKNDFLKFPNNKGLEFELNFSRKAELEQTESTTSPEEEQSEVDSKQQIKDDFSAKFKQLNTMNCSTSTIATLKNHLATNKAILGTLIPAGLEKKLDAYQKFFDYVNKGTCNVDDVKAVVTQFTPEQQAVVNDPLFAVLKSSSTKSFNEAKKKIDNKKKDKFGG